MQKLTFELIGAKAPLTQLDSENIRTRSSNLGFIDPSIILKTDDTVNISIDKHIHTISTNLIFIVEPTTVSATSTITLAKNNHGIQEVIVNLETELLPAYGETLDYTVADNVITLGTNEYNGKSAYIKYLTTN